MIKAAGLCICGYIALLFAHTTQRKGAWLARQVGEIFPLLGYQKRKKGRVNDARMEGVFTRI